MDAPSILAFIEIILFFSLFTVIGFPYAWYLFPQWRDKGLPFAKFITLGITAYVVWLLASLTSAPFATITVVSVLLLLGIGALVISFKKNQEINTYLSKNWKLLLFEELFFLGFFCFFACVRWLNPDLWHPIMGGEKPMDFAFLNALLKSETFPPYDPWYAGGTINYYYFGQYLLAVFIKATGIPAAIFYNLALAYLFGQCAAAIFSIVFHITSSKKLSALGSIFAIALGNLAQIPVIIKSFAGPMYINGWYWTATRVMPNYEINEFPYFSFLYADLHAHMIAIPIDLFIIALVISLFTLRKKTVSFLLLFTIAASLLLGMIRVANIWDYPSYFLFIILGMVLSVGIARSIIMALGIFSLSNFAALPFILNYKTAPIVAKLYQDTPTRIEDYLLIHGFFLFILFSFLLISIFQLTRKRTYSLLLLCIAIFASVAIPHYVFPAVIGLIIVLHLFLIFSFWKNPDKRSSVLILFLSGFAFFLTLIPDVIDLPVGLGRMNTVFKFYFQAWIFFALASAMSLPLILAFLKKQKVALIIWGILASILFLGAFSYVPTATVAKVKDRMSTTAPHTLNGMTYMKSSAYYDQNTQFSLIWDYLAIQWLNENIHQPTVILEGNAPIYRWGNRVSMYTGLPTVIGWDWHEKAHRSYLPANVIDKRVADVKLAYETPSLETLKEILHRYNIEYIYLGQLEKAYYNNEGFTKFTTNVGSLFDIVYQNQEVTIYKVK